MPKLYTVDLLLVWLVSTSVTHPPPLPSTSPPPPPPPLQKSSIQSSAIVGRKKKGEAGGCKDEMEEGKESAGQVLWGGELAGNQNVLSTLGGKGGGNEVDCGER